MDKIYDQLNQADKAARLQALGKAIAENKPQTVFPQYVNNHVHTTYSFSPYSPTAAVYAAYITGLTTVGIMDHDSIGGAREFRAAGNLAGIATTVGIECRCSVANTPLFGRRINNPDQQSVMYTAVHGIPHTQFDKFDAFFSPYRAARNVRNEKMVANINNIVGSFGISLDFARDVYPLSQAEVGGTVTERHLLFALSKACVAKFGKGEALLKFLEGPLKLSVSTALRTLLLDAANPYYEYDLLGVFKGGFVEQFYISATEECPHITDLVALAQRTGSILCYPYLGDVTASVTGDKKAQTFEDGFLDELFEVIHGLGIQAVTYMPTRNTPEQLSRLRALCAQYGMFEVSGEDINTPRQGFICKALDNPAFSNLIEATWALIGHEKAAAKNLDDGMFTQQTIHRFPELSTRVAYFSQLGKTL